MSITPQTAIDVLAKASLCLDRVQIQTALDHLAGQLKQKYQHKNPLFLCVMNGGLVFCAELLLRLDFPLQYDYLHATRYQGNTRGGELNWIAHATLPMKGRHIVVVDDINDEGITLAAILKYCREQGAESAHSVVMVEKQHDRQVIAADYCGLKVPDAYVFGYGMDYKGYWRNLPEIYAANE